MGPAHQVATPIPQFESRTHQESFIRQSSKSLVTFICENLNRDNIIQTSQLNHSFYWMLTRHLKCNHFPKTYTE